MESVRPGFQAVYQNSICKANLLSAQLNGVVASACIPFFAKYKLSTQIGDFKFHFTLLRQAKTY